MIEAKEHIEQPAFVHNRGAQYGGEVVYIYAFDIAYDMSRRPIPELLGQPVAVADEALVQERHDRQARAERERAGLDEEQRQRARRDTRAGPGQTLDDRQGTRG